MSGLNVKHDENIFVYIQSEKNNKREKMIKNKSGIFKSINKSHVCLHVILKLDFIIL